MKKQLIVLMTLATLGQATSTHALWNKFRTFGVATARLFSRSTARTAQSVVQPKIVQPQKFTLPIRGAAPHNSYKPQPAFFGKRLIAPRAIWAMPVRRVVCATMVTAAAWFGYGVAIANCTPVTEKTTVPLPQPTSPEERLRINKLLDEHADEIACMFALDKHNFTTWERATFAGGSYLGGHPGIIEFPWLPGYIIKKDSDRIEGAQAIANCIQKYGLQHVAVAEKWPYTLPSSTKTVVAVVKKIEVKQGVGYLNLAQAKDLCCVLRNTKCFGGYYYSDLHGENLMYDLGGRVVLIDTESRSFFGKSLNDSFYHLLIKNGNIDDEASMFLKEQWAQISYLA